MKIISKITLTHEKQPKNNVSVYFSHFPGMNKILEKVPIDKQLGKF